MKKVTLICIFSLIFFFQGCFTGRLSGAISVEKKLSNPIIVDFVFVFEQQTLDELQKIPSMQWFSKRSQYRLDLELNNKIQILSYELVPGQKIDFQNFRPKQRNEGLIIFVSYMTPGDHRVVLKEYKQVNLVLDKDDFTVNVTN